MSNIIDIHDQRVLKELKDLEVLVNATQALVNKIKDDDIRQHNQESVDRIRAGMDEKRKTIEERTAQEG